MVHLFLWLIRMWLSISVLSVSLLLFSLYRYYQVLSLGNRCPLQRARRKLLTLPYLSLVLHSKSGVLWAYCAIFYLNISHGYYQR